MNVLFDPVQPWGRLWEVLLAAGTVDRWLALLGAVAAMLLPMLLMARPATLRGQVGRPLVLACLVMMSWAIVLVLRHGWAVAWADAGSLALLWLVVLVAALLGPGLLAGVSLGSYLGSPRGSASRVPVKRLAAVFALRGLAFFLAFLAVARPAFAYTERAETRSALWLAVDDSRSMSIVDEGERSRWKAMLATLEKCRPLLDRLRDEKGMDIRIHRFSSGVADLDLASPGSPEGTRTDTGLMLRTLFDRRDPALPVRYLLVLGDGADNGSVPALGEAPRWRGADCPIHAFGVGKAETTQRQNDVAIVSIDTSPQPFVPVKGKLTVKLTIEAHGYEGRDATLQLFVEHPDDKGKVEERKLVEKKINLRLRTGNVETLTLDAPAHPCEMKLRAVVIPPEPDSLPLNNTIETFVTVSREGMNILLVDRIREEGHEIDMALASDPRMKVTRVYAGGKATGKDVLGLDGQPYDAILLGGITADELRLLDPQAIEKIEKMVAKGAGLMLLGGIRALGAGGWKGTALEPAIPVDVGQDIQSDEKAKMVPTEDGVKKLRYLFDLDGAANASAAWTTLGELHGFNALSSRNRLTDQVLAKAGDSTILVTGMHGSARVLAFGGDTTHRWLRREKTAPLFIRFWRRVATWLARQEDAEGGPWVRPDVRRIPVRADLAFSAGVRSKGGGDMPTAVLEATVTDPDGKSAKVALARGATESRGLFTGTAKPGIYRVSVKADGVEASSRVIVYDKDAELTRPAADPAFLAKLATAGGGEAARIERLPDFLKRLLDQSGASSTVKRTLRPDWRTRERSAFLGWFLAVFCAAACAEWGLRRWWGMA